MANSASKAAQQDWGQARRRVVLARVLDRCGAP